MTESLDRREPINSNEAENCSCILGRRLAHRGNLLEGTIWFPWRVCYPASRRYRVMWTDTT